MNDLIYKLAEQSYVTGKYADGHGTWEYFDKTKFAELIVQECTLVANEFVENNFGYGYNLPEYIKERFGIE